MYLYTLRDCHGEALAVSWTQDGPRYRLSDLGIAEQTMNDLIARVPLAALRRLSPAGVAPLEAGTYRLLAPIPRPKQDVLCLGINYADHAAEAAQFSDACPAAKPAPIYCSKPGSQSATPGAPIH